VFSLDFFRHAKYNTQKGCDSMRYYTEYPSPIGPLTLVSDGSALTGLWMQTQHFDVSGLTRQDCLPLFTEVSEWMDAYFAGNPVATTFTLSPAGTAFQKKVWEILLTISYGKTTTYGAIARQLGPNMSAQAVGQAVGKNPIAIIIPCHRVVGAKGQLTGYAGGIENKKWLLRHEEETK
jgi:methylated-DNA-[protein]-cysteine S-methyltransferase